MVKKKSSKKKDEPLYVGLLEPIAIYKEILNTNKSLLMLMQHYENIRSVRTKKEVLMTDLHKIIIAVKSKITKIKTMLPHHELEKEESFAKELPREVEQVIIHSEVEKLNRELADIEKKLGSL